MKTSIEIDQLNLYKSLFKGREDVFAVRWEKNGKGNYMPAFSFDPHWYKLHLAKGGTFQTFHDKTYKPLNDQELLKHLNGEQVVGLYPLLQNNTSWFIAADFDELNWVDECRSFLKICEEHSLPAYLERSRSGKGGHVWVFFEEPYEAFRSRKIVLTLLEKSGIISIFDKNSSFDRLFPNQDTLSKKGVGNLIALPLNKSSLDNGNSCFVDSETLKPYDDQWKFLQSIKRAEIGYLNELYKDLVGQESISEGLFQPTEDASGKVIISLHNEIRIGRTNLPATLVSFLKEELNFANTEFQVKKNINKSTFGIKRYFKLLNETSEDISIPRGFIGKLLRFCIEKQIDYILNDHRIQKEPVLFKGAIELREYQRAAKDAANKRDFGVIVAPPGAGKTIVSLAIIQAKQQPTLILVHRKTLADQWIERIESFLGIAKKGIGKIGAGRNKLGKQITVAMIQSMEKVLESEDGADLCTAFGTIIIDECHHVPAETYQKVISKLNSYYLYGLTATPFRKYNDGKLIFIHLGEIIHEIKSPEITHHQGAKIKIRDTGLFVPFNIKTDKFETLFKILVHDSARNQLILNDVIFELNAGNKVVILTERKEHIASLQQYLKQAYDTIAISGEDLESQKKSKWTAIKNGDFQALITTGQYFGEGTDVQNITTLFLVYPFAFEGKLVQYIGRVQRSEIAPTIYDYRDRNILYLEKLFQKRNAYYNKIKTNDLNTGSDESEAISGKINERIEVPIETLEFKFGSIAFKYRCELSNDEEIDFEIENLNIRPEFSVLKPYFIKFLKKDSVNIHIQATVQHNRLIFKSAASLDLDKINREVIDSVKFRFLNKGIIKGVPSGKINLLDAEQLQGGEAQGLYGSEEVLLENILSLKHYKHHRHLRYLSKIHESAILKLRFVLEPFSFVFLISGVQRYHLVWETLDTEEATYIWHIEKAMHELTLKVKEIDRLLGEIRINGRQAYLDTNADNFSRVVHDYSDDPKGFILWKDLLEEKLF